MTACSHMPRLVAPETLEFLLSGGSRLGLLDVREEGEFNGSHISSSVCVPRRVLEMRVTQIFPCKHEQLIVCDDNGARAMRAAETLERLGYTRVAVLWGGVNRWFSEDRPTEWGINVPSKVFGERVEVGERVPTWTAMQLADAVRAGSPLRIFDTRTPEEFARFTIPGAECIPNVEIALRAFQIMEESSEATIVVNCGGRTRSIIGASTLRRMGVERVVSLKNGTSGWVLAGFDVERGSRRIALGLPSATNLAAAERRARAIAAEDGVSLIHLHDLEALQTESERSTVYFVDVRTREEYLQGHIPGFVWFPGGQAIQRSEDVVPIRDVPVVFCCDDIVRAAITASWFRRMGYSKASALNRGIRGWLEAGKELDKGDPLDSIEQGAISQSAQVTPQQLLNEIRGHTPPIVLFVGTSREYADGHVPGSFWLSRSWLDIRITELCPQKDRRVVLTDLDGRIVRYAADDLARLDYRNCLILEGGVRAWSIAGYEVEQGLTHVMSAPEDVLPTIPLRSYENMMNYLRWEEALGHV